MSFRVSAKPIKVKRLPPWIFPGIFLANHNLKSCMNSKTFLAAVLSCILLACAFCGYQVHRLSGQQQEAKADYSIMNNISFGMLSVSEWRDQVVAIVGQRIEHFKLEPGQKEDLKKEVEQIMNALVSEAVRKINQPAKTLGGKIKKVAFRAMVDTADLHHQVPAFAQKIIDEIEKPSSMAKMKNIAQSELNQLGQDTYDSSVNEQKHVSDSLFAKYKTADRKDFDVKNAALLESLKRQSYAYSYGMLGAVASLLLLWIAFRKKREQFRLLFLFSVLVAFVLLLVGVTSTMIELDARISSLDFHLIGSDVSFKNQVLFFQSKSIIDVVHILIVTGKADMIIVGMLVFCFSVIFPLAKLSSELVHVYGGSRWRSNKLVEFFAFKSGKWSMADVTVVAIMMAYIGFNGVIANQLESLNIKNNTIASVATNNTSLQPGYIIFTGYVIFGLFLSVILKKVPYRGASKPE
jgi:hypothetical protein